MSVPRAGAGAFHYQTLFWIGPAGAVTGMHMDMDALNLLFQLNGTKRLWVYPISQVCTRVGRTAGRSGTNVPPCSWVVLTCTCLSMPQSPLVYPSSKYDLGASLAEVDHFQPNLTKCVAMCVPVGARAVANTKCCLPTSGRGDRARYPLFAQARPLEIVAHPGDVVFIPSGWYHAARSDTVSVSVSVRLFTLCEALAVAPLTLLDIAHNLGWYRHSDCVCHNPAAAAY